MIPAAERFWAKVQIGEPDECWEWDAARATSGYGRFRLSNEHPWVLAHRVAYEFAVGPIPEGLEIDHLCRNRACVNPAHLEPVTRRENVLRGYGPTAMQARQTICRAGHRFDSANTYTKPNGNRQCRTCHREQESRRRQRVRNG